MANIIKLVLNTQKLTRDIEITRSKYLRTYNRYKNDKHADGIFLKIGLPNKEFKISTLYTL